MSGAWRKGDSPVPDPIKAGHLEKYHPIATDFGQAKLGADWGN
jgi:hypothetical protein